MGSSKTTPKTTPKARLTADLLRKSVVAWNAARANTTEWPQLSGEDLSGLNLSGANLIHARLASTNLRAANLTFANLNGADLSDASMEGADLTDANLLGCHWCGSSLGFHVAGPDVGLECTRAVVCALTPEEYQVLLDQRKNQVVPFELPDYWEDDDIPF